MAPLGHRSQEMSEAVYCGADSRETPGGQKGGPSRFQVMFWEAEMFHLQATQRVGGPDVASKNIGCRLCLHFTDTMNNGIFVACLYTIITCCVSEIQI